MIFSFFFNSKKVFCASYYQAKKGKNLNIIDVLTVLNVKRDSSMNILGD